jgi:hypothetical protein
MIDLLEDILEADPARVEIFDRGRHVSLLQIAGDARLIPDLLVELRQLRAEHASPSPNGRVHGTYAHVCGSCGREFDSNRRQLPGKRSWCGREECKKLAAAERAKGYRDRKSKEAK